jgi:hypothetical protein
VDGDWRLVCVLEEKCKVEGDDGDGWVKADLIIRNVGRGRSEKLKMVLRALNSPPMFLCTIKNSTYSFRFMYYEYPVRSLLVPVCTWYLLFVVHCICWLRSR